MKKTWFLFLLFTGILISADYISAQTSYETCIEQGGDYNDCKDRPGAPAQSTSSCSNKSNGDSCVMYDGTPGKCDGGHCVLNLMNKEGGYYSNSGLKLTASAAGQGWNPGNYAVFGLPSGKIYDIIYNFLFWILALFGAFGLIGFAISGIMYLTAAGDDDQIQKAKKAMTWSLVGVAVGLAGLVIIYAVDELLRGQSTRF